MDFDAHFRRQLATLRSEGNYRVFAELERCSGAFPRAKRYCGPGGPSDVTVWCSNDYLGMGQNPVVLAAMHEEKKLSPISIRIRAGAKKGHKTRPS
jgi:5-aminolevulinate synthase